MKLYVIDPTSSEKHYLKHSATTRNELAQNFGSSYFRLDKTVFSIEDVHAEPSENTAAAMAAGGVIGAAGGVPGVIIGGAIGFLLGMGSDDNDKESVEIFNRSCV